MPMMRLRLAIWTALLILHLLAIVFSVDAIAPAVAGSVYIPLAVVAALGLPVFGAAETGGWATPSLFAWGIVAASWAVLWWGAASVVASILVKRRARR